MAKWPRGDEARFRPGRPVVVDETGLHHFVHHMMEGNCHVINHFVRPVYVFTLGIGRPVALYFTMLHAEF